MVVRCDILMAAGGSHELQVCDTQPPRWLRVVIPGHYLEFNWNGKHQNQTKPVSVYGRRAKSAAVGAEEGASLRLMWRLCERAGLPGLQRLVGTKNVVYSLEPIKTRVSSC